MNARDSSLVKRAAQAIDDLHGACTTEHFQHAHVALKALGVVGSASPAVLLIERKLLSRLVDRLEARTPEKTIAQRVESYQHEANEGIERDRALVDEVRHLLRPQTSRPIL